MNASHILLTILLFTSCASLLAADASRPVKPNILFVIAGDWSYGHAGAYGCTWIKTSAMDRVAHNGFFSRALTHRAVNVRHLSQK